MKRLTQELSIGKAHQGMDLYATVQVEGQKPNRFKCNSFLGAFVRELYGTMAGGKFDRPVIMGSLFSGGGNAVDSRSSIDSINTNSNNEISVNSTVNLFLVANNWGQPNATKIWIWGVQGIPEANGLHFIEKIDNDEGYLVDAAGVRLTSTGMYTNGTGRLVTYQNYQYRNNDFEKLALGQWRVIVGAGTSAVKASDIALSDRLQHGNGAGQVVPGSITTYSVQTTDKPTTRMTLTRSFTNNSGAAIDINEIGIITSTSSVTQNSDYTQFLIVRDVLGGTQTVPDGKTITIDYEVVFELSPDTQDTDTDGTNGGFLQKFMELLRLNLINYDSNRSGYFGMGLGGAISNPTDNDGLLGWQYGLRVGTDNKFTSMTDADLIAAIAHGDADGQLWHHGVSFNPPVIDDQANEAYYTVQRFFQNRGAAAVSVAEMGLYGNDATSGYASSPKLLTRTALADADQVTVQPGELLLAEYIIKAII